mmetsp:Transcript_46097/g.144619  ORF Transcript_46097/g.144619 Transcript_46097/m.144619 type:complete len:323 (-) Transcript_46097:1017-1985(-)
MYIVGSTGKNKRRSREIAGDWPGGRIKVTLALVNVLRASCNIRNDVHFDHLMLDRARRYLRVGEAWLPGRFNPSLEHPRKKPRQRVVQALQADLDHCSDGDREDHSDHPPQGPPQHQREQHHDRVEVHRAPEHARLDNVAGDGMHEAGDGEGKEDVEPGLGGVEDHHRHREEGRDHASHVGDEVEEPGQEAEHQCQVDFEDQQGNSDDDAGGGRQENLEPDVALHLHVDLCPHSTHPLLIRGARRVPEEQVHGEQQHQEAIRHLLYCQAHALHDHLAQERRVVQKLLCYPLVADVHTHQFPPPDHPVRHRSHPRRVSLRMRR